MNQNRAEFFFLCFRPVRSGFIRGFGMDPFSMLFSGIPSNSRTGKRQTSPTYCLPGSPFSDKVVYSIILKSPLEFSFSRVEVFRESRTTIDRAAGGTGAANQAPGRRNHPVVGTGFSSRGLLPRVPETRADGPGRAGRRRLGPEPSGKFLFAISNQRPGGGSRSERGRPAQP